jgi:SAM-dependent methyltransferase
MKIKEWSRNWFNNFYKEDIWGYTEKRFFPIVYKYMGEIKGAVLDAACGLGNPYLEKLNLKNSVGIDIDPVIKDRNKQHQNFIIQDLHFLNTEQRFEGIISVYTWEHLRNPEIVLKNIYNILLENGILLIIVPQRWHYISVLGRLLPNYFKNIVWRVLKGKGSMPFPVFWKLCSKKQLFLEARRIGFKIEHFSSIEGPPIWFARIPPLFILACFWMQLINRFKIFENIRGTFIAVFRKV